MKKKLLMGIWGILIIVFFTQCNSIDKVFKSQSPYEKYVESLRSSSLDGTLMGRNWIIAGERSLSDSLFINLPYSESGYFVSDNPDAKIFNFLAYEGTILHVDLNFSGDSAVNVFIDLFSRRNDWWPDLIMSSEKKARQLEYEIKKTGIYSLRIQPELLSKGYFNLTLTTSAVYAFPVAGKNHLAIGSVFGDPRDGGKRRHEGVDVFAQKGTPVVAVTDGRITRVHEKGIGGKVIWHWDNTRNMNIYYAHLDSQLVSLGQYVKTGDTVGWVGNSGNAIRTPPHLHFGIYKRGLGALDPYTFVHQPQFLPIDISDRIPFLHSWKIITAQAANIRISPTGNAPIINQATKDTPVYIIGATKDWYRVVLPNNSSGFVHQSLAKELNNPIANFAVQSKKAVVEDIYNEKTLLGFLEPDMNVPVFGKFLTHYLVSFNGVLGWINEM